MWNLFLKGITTLFCLFTFAASFSQTFEYPWSISLGASMVTYQAHPSNAKISPLPYAPTLELGASKYLNGGFDFRTNVSLSHQVNFPNAEGFFNSHLIDMNYQMAFKFNNGVFLKRNSFIGPYLLFGIGGSYVQNNPDAYIPVGGGVRFRLGQRFAIKAETVKKISLNKDYQNIAHAIAFVYNLDTKSLPENIEEEQLNQEVIAAAITAKDSDLDGVPDLRDQCPDTPGDTETGCPGEEKTEIAIAQAGNTEIDSLASSTTDEPIEKISSPLIASSEKPIYSKEEEITFGRENRQRLMALVVPAELISKSEEEEFEKILLNDESEEEMAIADEVFGNEDENGLFLDSPSSRIDEELPKENPTSQPKSELIADNSPKKSAPNNNPPPPVNPRKNPCGTLSLADANADPILFETGSDQIPETAIEILDGIAEKMKSCSYTQLVLNGHADAQGSDKDNLVLSIMRAYNVKYYLVSQHGISQRRINSKGFGEQKPFADNTTTTGRDQNRRVDFQLIF